MFIGTADLQEKLHEWGVTKMVVERGIAQPDSGQQASGGAQDAVIFIHGFLDSHATWGPLIQSLSASASLLIALDLRGAGALRAHVGPYTLQQSVADIMEMIELRGINRFSLVGHSMGAQIAELIAWQVPEQVTSLTLITPTPLAGNTLPDDVRTFLRESGGDPVAQREIRRLFSKNLNDDQLDLLVARDRLMGVEAVRGYYDAFSVGDSKGLGPCPYEGPTLILGAMDDLVIPLQQVEEIRRTRLPNAAFQLIEDSGHWPQLEQPAKTAAVLAEHLGLN